MWQISNFCEIHSLSYEVSKFFAMLSLCVFFGRYFAPGVNIVPPIAYKSHSTRFPIRPHVLTPHSWLCGKNCGRSSAPKFGHKLLYLVKLAWESQLTVILFKLIISGACQWQGFTIVLLHTYYYSSSGQNFGSLLLLDRSSQTHERGVKSCGLLGKGVLYLF